MNLLPKTPIRTFSARTLACALIWACGASSDATHLIGAEQDLGSDAMQEADTAHDANGDAHDAKTDEDPPASSLESRVIEIGTLENTAAPASCIARFPERLPDCAPSAPQGSHGIDCDGDGVWDHEVWNCDPAQSQRPPYFGGSFDCEPNDPGLRHWVTPDADGDGSGTGASFCAGPDIPPGFIALTGMNFGGFYDCDDTDPAIHPRVVDTWGDGVDSDCGNDDFPRCDRLDAGADFPIVTRAATSASCAGPDLYLSGIAVCWTSCRNRGSLRGFVGNSGELATASPTRLHFRDSGGRTGSIEASAEALAPGETSALFEVELDFVTEIEIWLESPDCTEGDDHYLLEIPSGDQPCLR